MEPKRVGIWIRVSTEDQAKGESPEHHEKRARYYAESKGWSVVETYHLEAVSGKSVMQHPEAQRMLGDIREGRITGLIFSKLARLARNTRELLDFADYFREGQADLISLQEAIDTSSPAGRLFYTMIAAMAQWEREEISDRVAASVPVRAREGKPLGGQAAFGFRWQGREYVVDEKEAPVRRLIYETFLRLKRKKTTANAINGMGHRTRSGSKFSDSTIERLIRDPGAKGQRIANRTKFMGEGQRVAIKPESEWVVVPCPRIVPDEVWDECNRILDEQYRKRQPKGPIPEHLLAGLVHCHCGRKMYVYHSPNFYCKGCKNKIPVADIEEIYHEQLRSFLLADTDVAEYVQRSGGQIREKEELIANMRGELASVARRMDELVAMRLAGDISKESFPRHYRPLEEQMRQLEDRLPEAQAEVDFLRIQQASSDAVLSDARDLYDRWGQLGMGEQRNIVETITERIVIGKDAIDIALSYLPAPLPINDGKRQRMPIPVVNICTSLEEG